MRTRIPKTAKEWRHQDTESLHRAVSKDERRKAPPTSENPHLKALIAGGMALCVAIAIAGVMVAIQAPSQPTTTLVLRESTTIIQFDNHGIEPPQGWTITYESEASVEFHKGKALIRVNRIPATITIQELTEQTVNTCYALSGGKTLQWVQPVYEQIDTKQWVYFENTPDQGTDQYRAYLLEGNPNHYQVIGIWNATDPETEAEKLRLIAASITK